MALATSNLSVKAILQTLGVSTAKAIFYNGGTLKTITELAQLVNKNGLNSTYCPGADADERLSNLRTNRRLSYFKGYVHASGTLTVSPLSFTLSNLQQDATLMVYTEVGTTWTATKNVSWITLYNTSGSGNGDVDFGVPDNTLPISREGMITITASNGLTRQIPVFQNPA